jgi:phenylalanyl-tRNA synthetase beta chain
MRVPLFWLKEYVDIEIPSTELVEKLTMAGLEVTSCFGTPYGEIFEIEITTNRSDLLSLLGIAREIYAIQGKGKLKFPTPNLLHKKGFDKFLKISILNREKCPRYTARIIEGVKIQPSPDWLKKRIESLGLRPVCNVVDITNFVLFEYGQPLHTFDLDKLSDSQLLVRLAKAGEKITTIDDIERTLDKDTLVIADSQKPIAIAGIMGGKNTEVSRTTKNILLESAYFNGSSIRQSSRKLALNTHSSYRFERGVDWQAVKEASDRAAQLISQIAGGKIRNEFFDSQPKKKPLRKIKLAKDEPSKILGVKIQPAKIKKILKDLSISLKGSNKNTFVFEIPSFRQDLKIEVDLVEEIARIWGYDRIPMDLPPIKSAFKLEDSKLDKIGNVTRQVLISLGFNEVITYSLINRDVLRNLRIKSKDVIPVQNPLSSEVEILRPLLLPSIVQTLSFNLKRRVEQVKIFELAHVYSKREQQLEEKLNLGFGLSGSKYIYDWQNKPKNIDFFDIKGVVEVLLGRLGLFNLNFSNVGLPSLFNPHKAATIMYKGEKVGYIGEVCEELLEEFDVNVPLLVGELFFENISSLVNFDKRFTPFPAHPFVVRDIAILIDENIPAHYVLSVIKKTGKGLIKDIKLFDRYAGRQIPEGCVSLAFSIKYQSEEKTLTDREANEVHSRICLALQKELKAKIR